MKTALRMGWLGLLLWAGTAHAARFGLFVGLNEYNTSYVASDNWLNYCVADAGSLRTNLINKGGGWAASNTTLLVDSGGSKTAIRAALSNYAAKAVSGDVVVYYHSSHGGNEDTTQANVYLCSYNADYTEDELATDLLAFKAGVKMVVVADACHSGGLFYETSAKSPAAKEARRKAVRNWNLAERVAARMQEIRAARIASGTKGAARLLAPEEVGWMTACAYYNYSYEDESIGHGWFTYRLLQGFDYGDATGDGWASFQELFDFAALRIPYADQIPQDSNPAILATLAGTAGAIPGGAGADAWDYADNIHDGAPALAPAIDFQSHGPHALRKDFDESDFFAVPVRKNRFYTFRSTNLTGDVDAYLYTYSEDAGMQLVRYAYDVSDANLNFALTYKAVATTTVYLQVQSYPPTNPAAYTLQYANAGTADSMATLTNGAPRAIASIDQESYEIFRLPVPHGQTNLAIRLSGGTGDADLYVARGYLPLSDQDYYSQENGNTEAVDVADPPAGDWFIQVYGYDPSANLTLRATYAPGAATVGTLSNLYTNAYFAVDLTNGARVNVYSATNFGTNRFNWIVRSNAATVVNGRVRLNLFPDAPNQIITVGRPQDL